MYDLLQQTLTENKQKQTQQTEKYMDLTIICHLVFRKKTKKNELWV